MNIIDIFERGLIKRKYLFKYYDIYHIIENNSLDN